MQILQLDCQGMPQDWISPEKAAEYYATDTVAWTVGAVCKTLRGGHNSVTGRQSFIDVHPILATNGASRVNLFDAIPSLNNLKLFRRDLGFCAYCGEHFSDHKLTREHIIPTAQRGVDDWQNVVSACKNCNGRKANRTPEQAHMPLLYLPYAPSVFEGFLLGGRNIQGEAFEWLASRVGKGSRWALN